jgi:Spy/CpxP family protein refolding chaperone
MKKVITAILVALFSATIAFAGPAERLNLTEAQKTQWRALQQTFHEQMRQMREAQEQKLMAILTDEQKAQFEQMKAGRRQHRHGRR